MAWFDNTRRRRMGRNIFQSAHPLEMARTIRKVVHEGYTDTEAYQYFQGITK